MCQSELRIFIFQVDIAYQLMKIAERLTDNDIGFALYLTDVSYDNFAINDDGKVIVIDLENIIVVDKARIKRGRKLFVTDHDGEILY